MHNIMRNRTKRDLLRPPTTRPARSSPASACLSIICDKLPGKDNGITGRNTMTIVTSIQQNMLRKQVGEAEWQVRLDLAAAYLDSATFVKKNAKKDTFL